MIQVVALPEFEKNLKRLNKKYQSLKDEYLGFVDRTENEGPQGICIGKNTYKARLAVKSKGKGKSGGLRIISHQNIILSVHLNKVYLVAIYDKSEMASIELKKIEQIISKYTDEE